jgi:DNA cross-link repair 1B protein
MLDHKDPDGVNYIVPYSLHSNYKEMEALVKAVNPSILRRLVI